MNWKMKLKKMWQLKTTTIPVIVGALGMIKKETDKHIKKIPYCPRLYEILKKFPFNVTEKCHQKLATINMKSIRYT